jgi:hypothetical protein
MNGKKKYVPAYAPVPSAEEIAWRAKHGKRYISAHAVGNAPGPTQIITAPNGPTEYPRSLVVGNGSAPVGHVFVYYFVPNYSPSEFGLRPMPTPTLKPSIQLGINEGWRRMIVHEGFMPNYGYYRELVVSRELRTYVDPKYVASGQIENLPLLDSSGFEAVPGTDIIGAKMQLFFGIHGAGVEHLSGAFSWANNFSRTNPYDQSYWADANNIVCIGPNFDNWYPDIPTPPNYTNYPAAYLNPPAPPAPQPLYPRPIWITPDRVGEQDDSAFLYLFLTTNFEGATPYFQAHPDQVPKAWWRDYPNTLQLPTPNLYGFIWLIDEKQNSLGMRTDLSFNAVRDMFLSTFPAANSQILLAGHSGGAQFVSHYMLLHPTNPDGSDNLNFSRVLVSSSGGNLFPRFDKDFPNGFNSSTIIANYSGQPPGFCNDIIALYPYVGAPQSPWLQKVAHLHRAKVTIFCGSGNPNAPDAENDPWNALPVGNLPGDTLRNWQGGNVPNATINYLNEMGRAACRAKTYNKGGLPPGDNGVTWPADAVYDFFHAIHLGNDHADMLDTTYSFIEHWWLEAPDVIPYYNYCEWLDVSEMPEFPT